MTEQNNNNNPIVLPEKKSAKTLVLTILVLLLIAALGVVYVYRLKIFKNGKSVEVAKQEVLKQEKPLDKELVDQHVLIAVGSKITIPKAGVIVSVAASTLPRELSIFMQDNALNPNLWRWDFNGQKSGYYIFYSKPVSSKIAYNEYYSVLAKAPKSWKVLYNSSNTRFAMIDVEGSEYVANLSFYETKASTTEISIQIIPKVLNKFSQ
jgi:hypothetical protein